jgi:hypothetical protein
MAAAMIANNADPTLQAHRVLFLALVESCLDHRSCYKHPVNDCANVKMRSKATDQRFTPLTGPTVQKISHHQFVCNCFQTWFATMKLASLFFTSLVSVTLLSVSNAGSATIQEDFAGMPDLGELDEQVCWRFQKSVYVCLDLQFSYFFFSRWIKQQVRLLTSPTPTKSLINSWWIWNRFYKPPRKEKAFEYEDCIERGYDQPVPKWFFLAGYDNKDCYDPPHERECTSVRYYDTVLIPVVSLLCSN